MKNKATAIIIDDEADIRQLIEIAFMSIGINCILSPTIADGIRNLKKGIADFVITDIRLPDGNGLDLVAHIQKNYPQLPVCVITAHGSMELALKSLKMGAFDFINKPFDLKQLRSMAKAALRLVENDKVIANKGHTNSNVKRSVNIIGNSLIMRKLDKTIKKLARSQAPVFIYGESGTGKELVARSIHAQSVRNDGPFIPINCGAIPENLVESELFGYKKGAFTDAKTDSLGLFASADGGTLFLDEIADLPLATQGKLLRAIQENTIRPIGGNNEIAVNVRILSATHNNLNQLVKEQKFRDDLYYRLNVISLTIPPLRERNGDATLLAKFIIKKIAKKQKVKEFKLTNKAIDKLNKYHYPGNVRELENILERAATFCENNTIVSDDINFDTQLIDQSTYIDLSRKINDSKKHTTTDNYNNKKINILNEDIDDLNSYLANIEKDVIISSLKSTKNNKKQAAKKLGVSFRSFRYKLQKYNIK